MTASYPDNCLIGRGALASAIGVNAEVARQHCPDLRFVTRFVAQEHIHRPRHVIRKCDGDGFGLFRLEFTQNQPVPGRLDLPLRVASVTYSVSATCGSYRRRALAPNHSRLA